MVHHPLKAVLDWLRSGYPEGVPEKDHFALLAVLRRRLSDDEIDQVVALSVEHAHQTPDRHIDYVRVRELIEGTIREEPSEEDLERVSRRLEEAGWSLATSERHDAQENCAVGSTHHDTPPCCTGSPPPATRLPAGHASSSGSESDGEQEGSTGRRGLPANSRVCHPESAPRTSKKSC
ncbi:DUF3349 domain-containing protein [Rhodococcus enclensis]|nr:DUF3349 domain-containing protein [Rhodococcus qingshengii]